MFKCSECGAIFSEKPQYCDCGNDIFEEVLQENKQAEDKNNDLKHVNQAEHPSSLNKIRTAPKPKVQKRTSGSKKASYNGPDKISIIIFAGCLLLSVVIMFLKFDFSNSQNSATETAKQENVAKKEIPNLDSFWINDSPKGADEAQFKLNETSNNQNDNIATKDIEKKTNNTENKKQLTKKSPSSIVQINPDL